MCRWLQPGIRRPVIVALHRSLGKLGQQGSNLNVLLNNVLNLLIVNLGPEGYRVTRSSEQKGRKGSGHHGREAIAQMQYKSQLFAGNSTKKKDCFISGKRRVFK